MKHTYQITGMTCDHCVGSVKEGVAKIDGVNAVDVDLDSGLVTIEADTEIADDAFAAAVNEAGYEVAP